MKGAFFFSYSARRSAFDRSPRHAATSGSDIVDLVSGGIAADSTVRAVTTPTIVSADASLAAGDKLAIVTPATWKGSVTILMSWL